MFTNVRIQNITIGVIIVGSAMLINFKVLPPCAPFIGKAQVGMNLFAPHLVFIQRDVHLPLTSKC